MTLYKVYIFGCCKACVMTLWIELNFEGAQRSHQVLSRLFGTPLSDEKLRKKLSDFQENSTGHKEWHSFEQSRTSQSIPELEFMIKE